jgi:hypothetical protein
MKYTRKLIGSWKSKGGKYWVKLYLCSDGMYEYTMDNGCGFLGNVRYQDALDHCVLEAGCCPSRMLYTPGEWDDRMMK